MEKLLFVGILVMMFVGYTYTFIKMVNVEDPDYNEGLD